MPINDRRERERAARRDLIITTARRLAEAEGWDAVTTRRLSTEIEYSQPVLYSHFTGLDQLVAAVALGGFEELTDALRAARAESATTEDALKDVAHAYVDFARANPALYDAMFTRSTTLHFAADDSPHPLTAGFAALRELVVAAAGEDDADTLTEVFWASLHGLVALGHSGRLRPDYESDRIDALIALALARAVQRPSS